jgi:hypothetical protein
LKERNTGRAVGASGEIECSEQLDKLANEVCNERVLFAESYVLMCWDL